MAEKQIPVNVVSTVEDDVARLEQMVRDRAYEQFEARHGEAGSDVEDWLAAERALLVRPAVEIHETPTQMEIVAFLAGLAPESLALNVTTSELLIRGLERQSDVNDPSSNPEWHGRAIVRVVPLPPGFDADRLRAKYRNGTLHVTAPLGEARTEGRTTHAA